MIALLLSSGPVWADGGTCEDERLGLEERVAACQRVLERAEDRAEALADIADVYYENDLWAEAVDFYSQAIDLEPEHSRAFGRRGVAYEQMRRFNDAEADFRRRIELTPDQPWPYYRLGRRLTQSNRAEEALDYLLRSVELDPEYHWGWRQLGAAYSRLNRDADAARTYRQLTLLRPFEDDAHLSAHWRYEEAGALQEAAYHARIAHTLNPNDLTTRDWLIEYLGDTAPADLEPLDWALPPEEQVIRYFTVRAPVDDRDEMTRAIEDMINFFGGNTYPFPSSGALVLMQHQPFGSDATVADPVLEATAGEELPPPTGAPRLYGMFPFFVRPFGPNGPLVFPGFDNGAPQEIWPLQEGNQASGSGRFLVDCTAGRGMSYAALGCLPGMEEVEAGQFSWAIDVSLDRIHVPMGIFDTYRIDMNVETTLRMFTQPLEADFTAGYWIDPGLNTWVARIFTAGDEYLFLQAMEVVEPD